MKLPENEEVSVVMGLLGAVSQPVLQLDTNLDMKLAATETPTL